MIRSTVLVIDDEKDLLILEINIDAKDGETAVKVPMSLVAVGKGE